MRRHSSQIGRSILTLKRLGGPSLLENRLIRAISIALMIALVLSAFFTLTSLATAPSPNSVEPEMSLPDAFETAGDVTVEAESPVLGPLVGLTREEVRAWAKKVGVPSVTLDVLSDERTPFYGIEERGGGGIITPDDASEVAIHNSDLAHMLGFDGTGVTVAVIDTGVDFAHPDLFNATFRVTDPGSDYYLHPMAYDASSLNDYLLFGEAGPDSWFVNTSFSTTVDEFDMTRWVNWTDGTTTLSWNVTGVANLTDGKEVRIGFHPDEKLNILLGMRPGLILFNGSAAAAGPFDSVMTDLDGDFNMSDEKRAWINTDWATFNATAELMFQDLDGDGIQDVSGGMVYFISDGVREIPYASRQIDVMNFTFQTLNNNNSFDLWAGLYPANNTVPGNGNLTLIFGDLNGPSTVGSHGTWVSSAIVGQGLTGGFGSGPVLAGQAPGAKILGAGNNFAGAGPFLGFGIFGAIMFASEGYDGLTGTGDEAQIASNSWGLDGWSGWDWSGRFVDYVSTVLADESILYVFSIGNSGPGMGNPLSPAGASLFMAGAMENYFYRIDPWHAFDAGPNPSFGGTAYFSTRGPSALGRHHLDALTSGAFAHGADPLNNNPFILGETFWSGTDLNGNSSWVLWGGTSLSAPNLAGVTALVYEAYASAHGGLFPMASTAQGIVKNAADDAGQDPFLTGAGVANALRAVLIASETDGLTTSIDEWNPGDFGGTVFDAYATILPAGGPDMTTITLTNHRPTMPLDVTIADAVLANTGSLSFNFTRTPGFAIHEFLFNGSGLMALDGSVLVPGSPTLWADADSIRVSVYYGRQVMIDDTPFYRFRIFDWEDRDANGSFDGLSEINLITQDLYGQFEFRGPNGHMFIHDPAARSHDGLYFRDDSFFDASGPVTIYVVVDYFERMDWPWLSSSVPMVTIPAASSVMVDLMVAVPPEAKPGLYEAMYLFTLDNGNVTTLPVAVNVAAGALPFTLGETSVGDAGHYQQGQSYGEADIDDSASGDWRYYFLDLPEAVNVTVLLGWDDPLSHYTLHVLTSLPDWFSDNAMARYGPSTLDTVAFTDVERNTGNGTSVVAPLNPGLSLIAVRSVFVAGTGVAETPRGQVGVIGVTLPSLTGIGVPVEGEASHTITSDLAFPNFQSFIESGSVLVFLDQPVDRYPCGGCQADFEQYVFDAPNTLTTTVGSGVSRATYELFFHSGARDVDMGVFYDAGCDDIYTVNDLVGLDARTFNPERVTVFSPPAGCYVVHAAGFDVDSGSLYDLTVTFVEQPVVSVTSLPSKIDAGVPAAVTVAWNLPHVPQPFVGNVFFGSMQFPLAIPLGFSLLPDLPPVLSGLAPADGAIIADNTPTIGLNWQDTPDAFETAVDPDSAVLTLDGADFTALALATANSVSLTVPVPLGEGQHAISVEVRDENGSVNRTTWSFTVDTAAPALLIEEPTVPITNDPAVTVSGMTEPGATVTINGTPVSVNTFGFFIIAPTLPDGDHTFTVVATDSAGNVATEVVDITVDTVAPAVSLTSPASGTTVQVATVTVTGTTEPGAAVTVNGLAPEVDANGAFSFNLGLTEGSNTITATATDLAGNSASTSVSVTYTDPVPGLQQDLDDTNSDLNTAQGNLATLNTQILILIGLTVAAFVLAGVGFFLYWSLRRKP